MTSPPQITAEHVLNVTKTINDNPNTFGKGIVQIDDGYQKMDGDWSANKKFPMGMAAVAKAGPRCRLHSRCLVRTADDQSGPPMDRREP